MLRYNAIDERVENPITVCFLTHIYHTKVNMYYSVLGNSLWQVGDF